MKGIHIDLDRPYLLLFLGVIGAVLLTEYAMDVVWKARYEGYGDLSGFYCGAATLKTGRDMYNLEEMNEVWQVMGDPVLKRSINHVFPYPPLVAVVLRPLTFLPIASAARIWLAFNALLWFVCLALLLNFLDLRPRHLLFWILLFVALRFEPALTNFTFGQVNIVIFTLVLLSLHSLKKHRPATAGLFLAAAVMFKITPLVLAGYFLLRRQYHAVLWTAVFGLGLLGLGFATAGVSPHMKYIQQVLPALSEGFILPLNQSITAFFLRLFKAAGWADRFEWAILLSRLAGLPLIYITFRCLWKAPRPAAGYDPAELSLCILLIAFISPVTWTHHLVWVMLPLAVLFHTTAETGLSGASFGLLLAAYTIVGVIDDYYVHPIFRSGLLVFVSSIKLYGLLVLYTLLLKIVRERRAVQPAGGTA